MKTFKYLLAKVLIATSAASFTQTTIGVSSSTRLLLMTSPDTAWKSLMADRLSSAKNNTLTRHGNPLAVEAATVDLRKSPLVPTQLSFPLRLTSASDPAWLWMWVIAPGLDLITA